ncbi:DUF350 domain-containing protein [Actinomycetospora cinnamomea]|nr:DUF350 domain-containing protein [Actinomycetospora cinnamomea]
MGVNIGLIAVYAVIGAVLMYIGYFAIDLTTPGDLRGLVREGRPNAVVVAGAGLVSMAFIVIVAIYISFGSFVGGILNTTIYGLVGIIAQVLAVRGLEAVARLDVDGCLHDDRFTADSAMIAAMHIALGLVVAVAII